MDDFLVHAGNCYECKENKFITFGLLSMVPSVVLAALKEGVLGKGD